MYHLKNITVCSVSSCDDSLQGKKAGVRICPRQSRLKSLFVMKYLLLYFIQVNKLSFNHSQCTVPVDQSEQTVLFGWRDFVENEAFERGGA